MSKINGLKILKLYGLCGKVLCMAAGGILAFFAGGLLLAVPGAVIGFLGARLLEKEIRKSFV